jgi:hypothetical protein
VQAEIPNHRKLRRSRAGVVSVAAKVLRIAGQVGDEKTNRCEPLLTHRNIYMVASKLGPEGCPRTKARPRGGPVARKRPACGPGGARCIGGVSSSQALAWNRRTRRPDSGGQSKGVRLAPWSQEGGPQASNTARGTSTDAGHGDGPTRSSEEGSVMGLKPRGRVDQGHAEANPQGEEPKGRPKPNCRAGSAGAV